MPGIQRKGDRWQVSQSWLNTFMTCPEQARLEMLGELPRKETDASALGSAMHAGIEEVLKGGSGADGLQAVEAKLTELVALPEFVYVQTKTWPTLLRKAGDMYATWYANVMPQLPGVYAIELPFKVELAPGIDLAGQIDLVDELFDIWDWKTSNLPYEQWQVDRWKIQPTAYTMGLADRLWADHLEAREVWNFHYAIMYKQGRKSHEVLTTSRDWTHWRWLGIQAQQAVAMIEADLEHWPLNDQHALCSPKWCPVWDSCKGAHITF